MVDGVGHLRVQISEGIVGNTGEVNDSVEASQVLEEATSLASAPPDFRFYLALAYHYTGEVEKARDALKRARDGGLDTEALSETDKQQLSDLEDELKR